MSLSGSAWLLALLLLAFVYDSGLTRSDWEVSDFPGRSDVSLAPHAAGSVLHVGKSSIRRFRDGTVLTDDNSGKGALFCTYDLYGAFRRSLAQCGEPRYSDLVSFIDLYRSEIRGHMARNNWKPVTRFQVDVVMGLKDVGRDAIMWWHEPPPGASCPRKPDWVSQWADGMLLEGRDAWLEMMRDNLSVARPPANNPCL